MEVEIRKRSYLNILSRAIKIEIIKLKSSSIFLAVIGIPLIAVLIGSGSFYVNQEALNGDKWFDLWTQVALFYGYFFYPLLIAILSSFQWHYEHLGNNWNLILTEPVPFSIIWFSKLIVLFLLALLTQILCLSFYFISGKILLRLSGLPPVNFFYWLIAGPVFIMATASFQSYLAMRIKSFVLPVGIAFFLTFTGLYGYTKGWIYWPYTLSIIGINAQHEILPSLNEIFACLSSDFIWIFLVSVLALNYLKRIEV